MATNRCTSTEIVIPIDIGFGLPAQAQGLRGADGRAVGCLLIDQPMQDVEDVGLGGDAFRQGEFDRGQDHALIVVQHERKNVDHFPVATRASQHQLLQLWEALWQLGEGGAIAQSTGLALDDRQVVAPVVDRARQPIV